MKTQAHKLFLFTTFCLGKGPEKKLIKIDPDEEEAESIMRYLQEESEIYGDENRIRKLKCFRKCKKCIFSRNGFLIIL